MTDRTPEDAGSRDLDRAVGTLLGVGRLWASHGLRVAELALDTSARTLRATADVLAEVSGRLDDERTSEDAGEPEPRP
jgi:hypothetical protein